MKTKIVVVGLGGVGGYYGGLLARKYYKDEVVEVCFLSRGEHLVAIQQNGLKVIDDTEIFVAFPSLAADNAAQIGIADYIIICTKSYDLEATIEQIKPMIAGHTVILPLLNGVDISYRISNLLPQIEVWNGCSYIISRRLEPGVIRSYGHLHALHFGYKNFNSNRLLSFDKILVDAGVDAHLSDNSLHLMWTKFFFISLTATLTSYFNVNFGCLVDDEDRRNTLIQMSDELSMVAKSEGVCLDSNITEQVIQRLVKIGTTTTTSMHSDFLAGRNTELQTLTGVVVEMADRNGVNVPLYKKIYTELLNRLAIH